MHRSELAPLIFAAVSSTLETVAFEEPILLEKTPNELPEGYWSEIVTEKPHRMKIILWTTENSMAQIVDAVTGGVDAPPNAALDTIGELANILAGIFTKQLLDDNTAIHLGLPIAHRGKLNLPHSGEVFAYELGDELFLVSLATLDQSTL